MKKPIIRQCIQWAIQHNTKEKHSQFDCYKHHSFIIQSNKIIEWGQNKIGPPPIGYLKHQKIHSEYIAWKKAKGLLNKQKPFDVINIRLNKQGNMKLSKPCSCCNNFLSIVNCKNIYYSTGIDFLFEKLTLK